MYFIFVSVAAVFIVSTGLLNISLVVNLIQCFAIHVIVPWLGLADCLTIPSYPAYLLKTAETNQSFVLYLMLYFVLA